MNNTMYNRIIVLISTLSSLMLAGCIGMDPPKVPFTAYVGHEKIHLKVGVNVTDELRNTEYADWHCAIGKSIAMNSAVLSRHLFDDVVDMNNGQLPPNATVDAVLTPKIAYINRTTGATSFGESIVDVKVEWALNDSHGNTIWVDTIDGQSTGSTGWTEPRKVLEKAIDSLMLKSEQAISSAPAIRQFAQRQVK